MQDDRILSYSIIGFIIGMALVMLLGGCSRHTPVSDINNEIQQEVADLVDYANNNMDMDPDKQLLLTGARHCASRANDLTRTCEQTVSAYSKEAAGWKLATTLMTIIAGLLGFLWIKK